MFIGIDSLGKEPLLAAVAAATGCPVRVTPERAGAAAAALAAADDAFAEAAHTALAAEDDALAEDDAARDLLRAHDDGDVFLAAAAAAAAATYLGVAPAGRAVYFQPAVLTRLQLVTYFKPLATR